MQQIVVYVDEGVSAHSLRHIVKSLKNAMDPDSYDLKRLNAHQLITQNWEPQTALFIIPGGRDVQYQEKLGREGTRKIRAYVESGGF